MPRNLLICALVLQVFTGLCELPPGIKAFFPFDDGDLRDVINGKDAKAYSVLLVDDRFGNKNAAVFLHGSSGSYLSLGHGPELKSEAMSISLWVKIDIAMEGGRGFQFNPVLRVRNDTVSDFNEAYSIGYDFRAGRLDMSTTLDKTRQVRLNSGEILSLREWHHVVLAFDDDSLWMYLDGKLESSVVKGFRTKFLKDDDVLVGATNTPKNERYLCGSVDDIIFYDRVITASEVQELFNAQDPNRIHVLFRWAWWALLMLAVIFVAVWFLLRRSKRELHNQKEKNEMLARMNEMETRAIRMQMNPHFMFNSLNTLRRFLLEEDIANAETYLIRFSRLLRRLIESSESETISLMEEVTILENYIEIEKLRFESKMEYTLTLHVSQPENTFIPFMMIQPLVENAIWHGLTHVEGEKNLKISISENGGKRIRCEVLDNGPGFNHKANPDSLYKKKSMALDFIRQRLSLLERVTGVYGSVSLTEKTNEAGKIIGTLATIEIPIMN